jgi:ABC-2 type transport system ATP-binding protein
LTYFSYSYVRPWPIDELIDAVGLTEKADTRTRHLSGGQRRRLDVALGIVGHPDILFLDEHNDGL